MKKIIILLITTTLLTGCSATYNITFNKENIIDSINIYEDSSLTNKATEKDIQQFQEKLGNWERGYEYYKRELYTTDEITGYNYSYNFEYNEYDAMSQLRKCYQDFSFTYDDNQIKLTTSKEFLCTAYYKDVSDLKITITSNYKIVNSNADSKNNNTHTWNITKNNYSNKPIEITIDKKENFEQEKESNISIYQILIIIIFLLLIIVLITRKKDTKRR